MISFIGPAFSSYPVRWIETPETAWSRSALDKVSEKSAEKAADLDIGKPRSKSGDILDLSQDVQKTSDLSQIGSQISLDSDKSKTEKSEKFATESTEKLPSGEELTLEELQQVAELKSRDQEVRVHEMAHVMAGGAYVTGGPSYTYQMGPDGKGYAIGGEVGIDTSPIEGNPEATIQKMQTVAAAALAPAKPSGQDQKVAAAARQAEAKARMELAQLQSEQLENDNNSDLSSKFSLVRSADKSQALPESNVEDTTQSLVRTRASVAEFAPSSAYKAQSTMTLGSSRFSAFA